jgi:hypothetical protein
MATEPPDIPHGMRRIYRRFAHWRSAHPGVRLPIPRRLWKAAAKVAREHGVCRTAQVLRLEYGKLKQQVESASAVAQEPGRSAAAKVAGRRSRRAKSATPAPAFMELVGQSAIGLSECLIELEGPHGKMRIQWKGTTAPDLAGLSRVLWERT